MNYVTTLIRTAFQWAIFLAVTGGLGEATLKMFKEARNAQSHGLISLSKLNHSLQRDESSVTRP